MKNIFTYGLLFFSILTFASDHNNSQRYAQIAIINKELTVWEEKEKICFSIFTASAGVAGAYFCADTKPMQTLIHCLKSKAIPKASGVVSITFFWAWLMVKNEKIRFQQDIHNLRLKTDKKSADIYDYYKRG